MPPVKLVYGLYNGGPVLHDALYNDESHTEYYQCYCNNYIVIKMLIKPVVKKNAYDGCRNTCKSNLEPHDSSESVGKDSTSTHSEGENNGQNIRQHSGSDVVVTEGEGNIGVTTYQKMMEEEMNIRPRLDIYHYIIEDIKKEFCVCVY